MSSTATLSADSLIINIKYFYIKIDASHKKNKKTKEKTTLFNVQIKNL